MKKHAILFTLSLLLILPLSIQAKKIIINDYVTYKGDVKNGIPYGKGQLFIKSNSTLMDVVTGEFINGNLDSDKFCTVSIYNPNGHAISYKGKLELSYSIINNQLRTHYKMKIGQLCVPVYYYGRNVYTFGFIYNDKKTHNEGNSPFEFKININNWELDKVIGPHGITTFNAILGQGSETRMVNENDLVADVLHNNPDKENIRLGYYDKTTEKKLNRQNMNGHKLFWNKHDLSINITLNNNQLYHLSYFSGNGEYTSFDKNNWGDTVYMYEKGQEQIITSKQYRDRGTIKATLMHNNNNTKDATLRGEYNGNRFVTDEAFWFDATLTIEEESIPIQVKCKGVYVKGQQRVKSEKIQDGTKFKIEGQSSTIKSIVLIPNLEDSNLKVQFNGREYSRSQFSDMITNAKAQLESKRKAKEAQLKAEREAEAARIKAQKEAEEARLKAQEEARIKAQNEAMMANWKSKRESELAYETFLNKVKSMGTYVDLGLEDGSLWLAKTSRTLFSYKEANELLSAIPYTYEFDALVRQCKITRSGNTVTLKGPNGKTISLICPSNYINYGKPWVEKDLWPRIWTKARGGYYTYLAYSRLCWSNENYQYDIWHNTTPSHMSGQEELSILLIFPKNPGRMMTTSEDPSHLAFDGIPMGSNIAKFKNSLTTRGWKYEPYDKSYGKQIDKWSMKFHLNSKSPIIKTIVMECIDYSSEEGMFWDDAVACYKYWTQFLQSNYGQPTSISEEANERDFHGSNYDTQWNRIYKTGTSTITLRLTCLPMTVELEYSDGK